MVKVEAVKNYLLKLQQEILSSIQQRDEQVQICEEDWQRAQGGGGKTLAITKGSLFEKAGINFSHVWGTELPASASKLRPALKGTSFHAVGLSTIIHPENPYVPTCHANFRFFQTGDNADWWFGGGFDLTPYYGFDEDCIHWHQTAKQACDPFGKAVYPQYKQWADDYFFLTHRNEPRGIGGIFFDDLNCWDFETCFHFLQSAGEHFIKAYFPIVDKRKDIGYGEAQKAFQHYRRGRYVEFNLLYDRGTLFGLQSAGRIESILISLPPMVSWEYNWQPTPGSQEAKLYEVYLTPYDWARSRLKSIHPGSDIE